MNGLGYSIKLFIGMVLFIPQLVLALIVGIGRLFPQGTFGISGASALAGIIINFTKEMFDEEVEVPTAPKKPSTRKKP